MLSLLRNGIFDLVFWQASLKQILRMQNGMD